MFLSGDQSANLEGTQCSGILDFRFNTPWFFSLEETREIVTREISRSNKQDTRTDLIFLRFFVWWKGTSSAENSGDADSYLNKLHAAISYGNIVQMSFSGPR